MIIFGTRGVTWNGETGEFACPGCGGTTQTYKHKTVRRFFTLYFIPIIPLDKIGEYIECQTCHKTYNDAVLSYDPAAQQEKARAEFLDHVKRTLILAAIDQGQVDEAKYNAIRETFRDISGTTLSNFDIQQEMTLARQAKGGMAAYAGRFAESLNEHGKEMVLKAVFGVLLADEVALEPDDLRLVNDLAAVMNVSQAHLRGILAELNE